jgi:hypothetical protein
MDKILSARVDETVILRIGSLARRLKISRRQILENAVELYAEKIEADSKSDVFEKTSGAWKRHESIEKTIRGVRNAFDQSMNTSAFKPLAKTLKFEKTTMWVFLSDGRQLGVPLAYFPRLLRATSKQRNQYIISGGGTGLHWDELDEDISVPALLVGVGDRARKMAKETA